MGCKLYKINKDFVTPMHLIIKYFQEDGFEEEINFVEEFVE